MNLWSIIMKSAFGTDTRCELQRERSNRMIADVEAKVDRLNATLDSRAPRNLHEAVETLTRS